MNVATILNQTTKDFENNGLASPRLDAEVLLARLLKVDRLDLFKYPERELTDKELADFHPWVYRRRMGEPVAYITGRKEFWSLELIVNPDVLIPRPDTEILVEEVLKYYKDSDKTDARILDVGTGSGAIIIALAAELKNASLSACDISSKAIQVALRNAEAHSLAHRIAFFAGDMFAPVSGLFDGIVSNPPYIEDDTFYALSREVRNFEPASALMGGPDGMNFHRRLIRKGKHYLKKGGRLFLEIGAGQKETVVGLFRNEGDYEDVACRKDYGGIERCITARRKN
ncbi:MAG: peptide chain release factor N(5)-glutamine methyltransferase [Deltaproteobacteria bacterium]|nr:peptide chain release factor N(5)-glutamine methyltransferase [Deltaproteobacteria bacterium]